MKRIKAACITCLLTLIRGYQLFISPLFGSRCRFHPSCSDYASEALRAHGVQRGILLTALRVLRCNPLCEGGIDPVPQFPERAAIRQKMSPSACINNQHM